MIQRLKKYKTAAATLASLLIVAFGQPAWSRTLGLAASLFGYALFFGTLLDLSSKKSRFWRGTLWFMAVQMVQLSWALTHPYLYIYPLYIIVSFLIGTQFGILSIFVTRENVTRGARFFGLAGLWTLLEWSRLFWFSGFTWNPVGLALSSHLYPMQSASIWGVYGLTFWVIMVNLLALRAYEKRGRLRPVAVWGALAVFPFLYGTFHFHFHERQMQQKAKPFKALLVQTAFPAEEGLAIETQEAFIAYVMREWEQILLLTKKHRGEKIDMIALPEFVVPFGTYTFIYPYEYVREIFIDLFGPDALFSLPELELPLARQIPTEKGPVTFVNNAYWAQALSNLFDAPIIAGLEDAEDNPRNFREFYSAALYFKPQGRLTREEVAQAPFPANFRAERYAKRVLVPMGEYIPFEFLRTMAASYGVGGSFTCGTEAKVLACGPVPFGVSICYEETFGDLMRENRLYGAELLVNLTSDVWYPDSRLTRQHFDHARLRTVEAGLPLIRACNTGLTCGIDSLGRLVAILGEEADHQWLSDSLLVEMPIYAYHTLYTRVGDSLVLGVSFASLFFLFRRKRR